jgi:tetratricopeptide (TPR) repeat protein
MTRPWTAALALALGTVLAVPALYAQKAPQPKSQKEIQALQAIQNAATPDERLKAIDSLLENFADTEYKTMVLQMAMQTAEQKGDQAATITYGERLLEAEPKNIFALSTLATEIAAHTREFDLDKEEKLAKAEKYANEAIADAKDAVKFRPDITDEQWNGVKKDIVAQSHDALGRVAMLRKKYDVAINEFQTSMNEAATPDSTTAVRLGEAYLQSGKYDDAIAQFDKATGMPGASPQVKQVANARKAEAMKLKANGAKPASPGGPAQVEIKK